MTGYLLAPSCFHGRYFSTDYPSIILLLCCTAKCAPSKLLRTAEGRQIRLGKASCCRYVWPAQDLSFIIQIHTTAHKHKAYNKISDTVLTWYLLAKGFHCAYTFWRTCANKVLCAVGRIVERKCRHRAADLCRKYCLLLKKWNIWHEKRNTYMIFAYITHFYRRWPKEELAREYKKNSTAEHAASIARAVIFFNNNQTRYALKRRGARGVAFRWHVSTPECTAVHRGKTAACGAKVKQKSGRSK